MQEISAFSLLRSRCQTAAFRLPELSARNEDEHPSAASSGEARPAFRDSAGVKQPSSRIKLHAQGLSKTYGASMALQPLELQVHAGELLALLGPSGSGKTTLLQIICGLIEPSSGRLVIDGRDETDKPANKRDIGVVFQNYALFPHLTVRENVSFPLQMRKMPTRDLREKVEATLAMVGLSDFADRFPRELSGGQQQRVALARCLVYQPSLILMDESLSALDRKLRENMQIEIKRLHRETGATIIFVTHDQEEALALADRICLMKEGRIEQLGTPEDIYDRPRSAFVADFIGISNVMHGVVQPGQMIRTDDGVLPLPDGCELRTGQQCALVVRPEKMFLCTADEAFVSGCIEESIYAGSETKLLVRLASGALITVRRQAGLPIGAIGERVFVRWDKQQVRILESRSASMRAGLDADPASR
jgi:putative spermidine/putrescine transport system ATP-binding protein